MDATCRACGAIIEPNRRGPRARTCLEHRRSGSRGGADPVQRRRNALLAKFGLSLEDYERRLDAQDGGCAGCGARPGDGVLAVDHDHATGRVRGLLCRGCNVALGQVRDAPETLRRLAAYLEAHTSRIGVGATRAD